MKLKISIFLVILTLIVSTMQLSALSYSVNKNISNYNLIYAYGRIRRGDLYRLQKAYNRVSKRKQTIVVFNSVGGELNEGIKIGRFLKNHRIGTAVTKNGLCASSCALAFLGGRDFYGRKFMILPQGSKLGFHSFYYRNEANVNLAIIQEDYAQVYNYATYVSAPSQIIAKMFKTKSNHMYWIKKSDRRLLGVRENLKNVSLYNRYAKANIQQKRANRYKKENITRAVNYSLTQTKYVKHYLSKINGVISANRGISFKDSTAMNSFTYRNWLSSQLKYVYLNRIKLKSVNVVDAEVIYALKNGQRVCSKNRYRLKQTLDGWRIVSKQHRACNYSSRKILKKIAYSLP